MKQFTPAGLKKVFDEADRQFESLPEWKRSGSAQFLAPKRIETERIRVSSTKTVPVKQLTPVEEEEYVRSRWNDVMEDHEGWLFLGCHDGDDHSCLNIHEAFLFTVQREADIADIQAEIAWLEWPSTKNNSIGDLRERILAREQAVLAELRRGWKEQG
jgi:hypothetical protein